MLMCQKQPVYRIVQTFILMTACFALVVAFYLENYQGLMPCPLCWMQRLCVLLLGIVGGIGVIFGVLTWRKRVLLTEAIVSVCGVFFSGRQLWLQSMDSSSAKVCLPGLDVMVHYLPWHAVMETFLWGAPECGEVAWRLVGWSLPALSLFYFTAIIAIIFTTMCYTGNIDH